MTWNKDHRVLYFHLSVVPLTHKTCTVQIRSSAAMKQQGALTWLITTVKRQFCVMSSEHNESVGR